MRAPRRTRLLAAVAGTALVAGALVAAPQIAAASPGAVPVTTIGGVPVSGYTPADIASAYDLEGGAAGTVAVVVPYSYASLEADLAVYRSQWGLPACTADSGCLRIIGQDGTATLPPAQPTWSDWDVETMLDVEAVSASCPGCSLVVAEARSTAMPDLGSAVNAAVAAGAAAVSMSWGAVTADAPAAAARYFTHPGVALVAASGDSGYYGSGQGAQVVSPASMPSVIAVGGTSLTRTDATPALALGAQALEVQGGTVERLSAATVAAQHRAQLARAEHDLAAAKRVSAAGWRRLAAARHALRALQSTGHRARADVRSAQAVLRAHGSAAARARLKARQHAAAAAAAALRRGQATVRHDLASAQKAGAAVTALIAAVRVAAARVAVDDRAAAPAPAPSPTPTAVATPSPTPTPDATVAAAGRTGWSETAWSGAGSGCSDAIAAPAWQTGTACGGMRAVSDVAADADPSTGLAIYVSTQTGDGLNGWVLAGGTSLAAPLVAGMIVRSGDAAAYSDPSPIWQHPERFWDVTSGASGSCSGAAVCTAGTGWDGPTGLGTPRSLASF